MNNLLLRASTLSLQKLLIFGFIAGAIYYQFLFDDGATVQSSIANVNLQIVEEEKKNVESEKAINEKVAIRGLVQSLSNSYDIASAQIPTEIQPAEILKTIDAMATASGVSIKSREPKKPEKKENLEEIPIRVMAEGRFSEITLFLYNMMKTERISRVLSVVITPINPRDRKNKSLSMDVVLANYRFLGDGKTKANKPGGSAGEKK